VFEPIDERARILLVLQALAAFVFFWMPASFGVFVLLAWALGDLRSAAIGAGALATLQGVRALVWPLLAWSRWGWRLDVDPGVLQIRRGVFFRTTTAIPLGRVQHVDVGQGPLERAPGLVRLQVNTASGLGADGVVPGLDADVAEQLRQALTRGDAPARSDGV
jgi:uncharacterized protein